MEESDDVGANVLGIDPGNKSSHVVGAEQFAALPPRIVPSVAEVQMLTLYFEVRRDSALGRFQQS